MAVYRDYVQWVHTAFLVKNFQIDYVNIEESHTLSLINWMNLNIEMSVNNAQKKIKFLA